MNGKIVVITGATSGIDKATAYELARRDAHVVLASRDAAKLETVRREIIVQMGNTTVESLPRNLASMDSICKCDK